MQSTPATGKCHQIITKRKSLGIMSRGTETFTTMYGDPAWCSRNATDGGSFCRQHQAANDKITAANAARRAARN